MTGKLNYFHIKWFLYFIDYLKSWPNMQNMTIIKLKSFSVQHPDYQINSAWWLWRVDSWRRLSISRFMCRSVSSQALQWHYSDLIMSTMASQRTAVWIVCSAFWLGTDQREHQSFESLAFVRGIHCWPVDSPHKGPITRKLFHLMTSSWRKDVSDNSIWKNHTCSDCWRLLLPFTGFWFWTKDALQISTPLQICWETNIPFSILWWCTQDWFNSLYRSSFPSVINVPKWCTLFLFFFLFFFLIYFFFILFFGGGVVY